MRRWRSEGWSFQRIADELTTRKVQTKTRRTKWSYASVYVIIRRSYKIESKKRSTASESQDEKRIGSEATPDWLFPNISGKGHLSNLNGLGKSSLRL